jgi:hypothetical protein
MSWTTIHLSTHEHPIAHEKCIEVINEAKALVEEEICCMISTKTFAIMLVVDKTFC